MTKTSKLLLALIGATMIALLFTSCNARWHMKKAIQKGAKVTTDTTYRRLKVSIPGVSYAFTPKPVIYNDTVYFENRDSVKVKVIVYKNASGKDSVGVPQVKCPDVVFDAKVPVKTETNIETPPSRITFMHLIHSFLLGGVFCFLIQFILKVLK